MSILLNIIPVSGIAGLIVTLTLTPVCKPIPLNDMGFLIVFDLNKTQ